MPIRRQLAALSWHALFAATMAMAGLAGVELIDAGTHRPAHAATVAAPSAAARAEPDRSLPARPLQALAAEHPELADLELVGRSIANYDR